MLKCVESLTEICIEGIDKNDALSGQYLFSYLKLTVKIIVSKYATIIKNDRRINMIIMIVDAASLNNCRKTQLWSSKFLNAS